MKKILEEVPSYYRIGFGSGNLIYFSHEISLKENEYIDLSIRDVIFKIDDLVEAYNSMGFLTKEIAQLLLDNTALVKEIEALRDQFTKLVTISPEEHPTVLVPKINPEV